VPVAGSYNIAAQVGIAATYSAGQRSAVGIYINDSQTAVGLITAYGAVSNLYPQVSLNAYPLKAGDTVKIESFTEGSSPSFTTGTSNNYFSIARVSGPSAIASTETVAARYDTTGTGNFANATIVNYDNKVYDTHGAVTTGASWKFTAPVSGIYTVTASFASSSTAETAGDIIGLQLYKNGSADNYVATQYIQATATSRRNANGSTDIRLAAGDYIDIRASLSLTNTLSLSGNNNLNFVCIKRTGN
jgi:hypothetical protein